MKERALANDLGLLLEGETALCLDRLQGGEVSESRVGERLVGQRPEMLGRLQFGRVGRQDEEVDALGDLDLFAGMPARPIEDEQDAFGEAYPHVPGEGGEDLPEEYRRDRGKQPPLGLPGRGMDKATDMEPLVALLNRSDRPLADRCPDPPDQGQQPDAMLVGGPELDLCTGIRCPKGCDLVIQVFF